MDWATVKKQQILEGRKLMADESSNVSVEETLPSTIPEPAQFKTPAIPKQNNKGPVQPMEYHTEITQRVGPAAETNGHSAPQQDLAHVPKKDRATVQLINKIAYENSREYRIEISRLYPNTPECPVGPIDTPHGGWGAYDDMLLILGKAFGHGGYKVRIFRNELFLPMNQLLIELSEKPEPVSTVNTLVSRDDDEETQLKRQRRVTEEKIKTQRTVAEYEKLTDEKEKRAMQPIELMMQQHKQQMELMQAQLKAATEAANTKKGPDILEIVAALGTVLSPILTALITKPTAPPPPSNDGMIKEVVNLMIQSNKQIMDVAMAASAKKEDPWMREILTEVLTKNVNKGEDSIKNALDLMDRGREQAKEMFELMKDDDDLEIDPNNIWGSVIAQGLKGLVHLFRHGGPQIAAVIAERMGKPAESVTDTDLAALAAELKSGKVQQALPQPIPPMPPMKAPSPNVVKMPPPVAFNPDQVMPIEINPPAKVSAPSQVASTTPPTESLANEAVAELKQAQPIPTPIPTSEIKDPIERDLREFVDAAITEYMLIDLKSERSEHEWPYFAAAKWSKTFKDQIVASGSDHMAKIKLIESKASPELWRQVEAELPKGRNWEYLQWSLTALLTEINNPSQPVVDQVIQQPVVPTPTPIPEQGS